MSEDQRPHAPVDDDGTPLPAPVAERRGYGLRPLSRDVRPIARKALGRRGLVATELAGRWREIVGDTLADAAVPGRLQQAPGGGPGTLQLLVAGSAWALVIQHDSARIIDAVNDHFGRPVVDRLKLVQTAAARGAGPRPPVDTEGPDGDVTPVLPAGLRPASADLCAALEALGRAIRRRDARSRQTDP